VTRILDRPGDQLPVEPVVEGVSLGGGVSGWRPLAMQGAGRPAPGVAMDVGAMVWDDEQQVMMLPDGADWVPAFKHTSTKTSTNSGSTDNQNADVDEDASGS
jgi:hypothetical protein